METQKLINKMAKMIAENELSYDQFNDIAKRARRKAGLESPKRTKKLPTLLSKQEIDSMLSFCNHKGDIKFSIMIKIFLYTAVRLSELINIEIKDVLIEEKKIHIRQGKGKKDRYVPLPDVFISEFRLYYLQAQKTNKRYLFESTYKKRQNPYTAYGIRSKIKRIAENCKIEKNVHPHLFRHIALTNLSKGNLSDNQIQIISGHSNPQNLNIYQHTSLAHISTKYNEQMALENY